MCIVYTLHSMQPICMHILDIISLKHLTICGNSQLIGFHTFVAEPIQKWLKTGQQMHCEVLEAFKCTEHNLCILTLEIFANNNIYGFSE